MHFYKRNGITERPAMYRILLAVFTLVYALPSLAGVDVKKLRRDGWRRDSHVLGAGNQPDYLLFKRGKEELKCFLQRECGSGTLNDCIDYCGNKPRPPPPPPPQKIAPPPPEVRETKPSGNVDPELLAILGDEAYPPPERPKLPAEKPPPPPPKKPSKERQKKTPSPAPPPKEKKPESVITVNLNRANSLIGGFSHACYVDHQTTLGNFAGIAFNRYAVFQKGNELYTCEIEQNENCWRLAGKGVDFFSSCLRVGSCIQNFRGKEDKQTPHCRKQ